MKQSVIAGTIASLSLLLLYGATMAALNSIDAALEQFIALWWLMLPLVVGFGIQVGLYMKLKQKTAGVVATGGTSAGIGMLACCAHHAVDVLPILGLSAFATLIGQYQKPILLLSLGINIIGIYILARHLRKTV